ncbi:MAG: hypothetical protein HQL98_05945 [Magnetococcales bacterium]|nr:hypothetical protein [Magnetococcales bacterium]
MTIVRNRPRLLAVRAVLVWPTVALLCCMGEARGVEVAPRMTDREIIQELATIRAGQGALNQRFEDMNKRLDDTNKRFDDVNRRFDDMNKRFDDVNKKFDDVNKKFDDVNKKFDDVNKRLEGLTQLILTLFGSLLGIILSFVGFIFWDRRTMMRPLEERMALNARELQSNQERLQEKSNLLDQLLGALRELARDDPKLSAVLRHFALL